MLTLGRLLWFSLEATTKECLRVLAEQFILVRYMFTLTWFISIAIIRFFSSLSLFSDATCCTVYEIINKERNSLMVTYL